MVWDILIGCVIGLVVLWGLMYLVGLVFLNNMKERLVGVFISWFVALTFIVFGAALIWKGVIGQGHLKILLGIGPFVVLSGIYAIIFALGDSICYESRMKMIKRGE
ncbi:MAG: hypothetical protein ACKKMS_03475 [Candidatus Nealsonbacteria bacterium]